MSFYNLEPFYRKFFDQMNISLELILRKADIPISRFTDEGLRVNQEEYMKLMGSIDAVLPDEYMLSVGQLELMTRFLPPLFAALCSKDGIRCFKRIAKYKQLIGPFILNVTIDEDHLHLEFIFDDYRTEMPRFTVMTEQVLMIGIIRQATGLEIKPSHIASQYDYNQALIDYFGIRPMKSDKNLLTFDLKDMKEPFLTENNVMWQYIEPELSKRLEQIQMDDSYSAQVRSTLIELIPAGQGTIDEVAKELAVSPRTLQRKLSKEETSFIKQLNHTRELMARNFLKDSSISNDEIAFLIGYSDANAFSRAFRTWTGMTVGDYRRKN